MKLESLIVEEENVLWSYDFISSQAFSEFINLLPEAVIFSDEDGNILLTNTIAQTLFGYTKKQFSSLIIEDLVPEKIRKVHPNLRKLFFENPEPRFLESRTIELKALRKDGSMFPMESSLFSIETSNGLYAVNLIRDVTDKKSKQKKLEEYAFADAITNLPNRRFLETNLEQNFKLYQETNTEIGIIFIDIDSFKSINDRFGHEAGDKAIKIMAERLTKSIREDDIVARFGGDEFVIMVFPLEEEKYLEHIADRVLKACETEVAIGSNIFSLNVSIGLTSSKNKKLSVEKLIKNADQAMYEAKNKGGNCYCCF